MSIIEIGKWNYLRNKLEFDVNLEIKMLEEEEAEFKDGMNSYFELVTCDNLFKEEYILDAVVEMVDAYCDYMYVYTGSSLKSIGTGNTVNESHKQSLMHSVLSEILLTHGVTLFDRESMKLPFIERCYAYVIQANELKPITKTKGKVKKGNDFKDPKELIRQELIDSGFLANPDEALERYKKSIQEKVDVSKVVPINNIEGGDIA